MEHGSFLHRSVLRRAAFLVLVLATAAATRAQAQTFTVLYSFKNAPDGAFPLAGLLMDAAGNLYGTTSFGGSSGNCFGRGCGTVFKLDTSGNETVLHSFTDYPGDGSSPAAGLIMDNAGNLFGTTESGGASFFGTVFKLGTFGNETILHSFTGSPPTFGDGANPSAALIMGNAGNLYGTTSTGGASSPVFGGTVFKLDTSGNETVLHSFAGSPGDGAGPGGALIMDAAGNLYGTTFAGGAGKCSLMSVGCGIVFKLDTSGNETVLYSFTGPPGDGANPAAGLIMDAAGNLYGTTRAGGGSSNCSGGCGTVFKLDTSGNERVLHSFTGSDGAAPGALIMDTAGNLYGTTFVGGAGTCNFSLPPSCGTVFKLDPSGNETVLHNFTGGGDGAQPSTGLIMDTAGNLYGTTEFGGTSGNCFGPGCGTVFKLSVQTPAPTITSISPASAIAGGAAFTLTVNGTNFVTGATISFNGNAHTTTFVGATQLTAAILASDIAIAGNFNVTVTNPGGGTSNAVSFAVNNPVPTITNISPMSAIAGGAAFTLTLNGANFVSGSMVSLNGNARTTTFVSATQLTAAILASDIATGGIFSVMVTNPAPGGGTSNAVSFTVQTPQQATQAIISAVNALFAQGVLNRGQHTSLVRKLHHAIDLMNEGKNTRAVRKLDFFISEVNDLLSSGVLSPSQAASLINAAESVIARLS